jgi:RNA polymerase sigma factor (sigma-70 family)
MAKANRQEARRLLWHWGRLEEYCKERQREIETYNELVARNTDVAAVVLNGMPHGTGTSNPTLRAAIELEKLAEMYADTVEEAKKELNRELMLKKCIDELLAELNEAQREIIRLRYKGGNTWAFISIKMNLEESWVRRLEANALDKISNKTDISTF